MMTCKKSIYGSKNTIWKTVYAASDAACALSPAYPPAIVSHPYTCEPQSNNAAYTLSMCGDIPPTIKSRAQILIKAYPQGGLHSKPPEYRPNSALTCYSPIVVTRGYLLGVCQAFKQDGKKLLYRRKFSLVSAAGSTIVLTEMRFLIADNRCSQAAFLTVQRTYSNAQAGCVRDPLDASMAYIQAMYYDGNAALNWPKVDVFLRGTARPSNPTGQPSGQPSRQPTRQPTGQPTGRPNRPTPVPTRVPTPAPTPPPTVTPTSPTAAPTPAPPVDAWLSRLTAAGTGASDSVIAAHRTFVAALSSANLLSKIVRINTFSGNNVAAALIPILPGGGTPAETTYYGSTGNTENPAVEAWGGSYSPASGLTSSGSQVLSTGQRISHTNLLDTSSSASDGSNVHMSLYFMDSPPNSCRPMGVYRCNGYSQHYLLADGVSGFGWGSGCSGAAVTAGLTVLTGTAAGASRYVCSKGSGSTCGAASGCGSDRSQPSDWPVGIFGALGSWDGFSTQTFYNYGICSAMRVAGYTIGYALSSADVTALNNAWNQLNAGMGRT